VFVDGHPVGGNPIKMNVDDSGGQSVTDALLSLYQVTNKWSFSGILHVSI
jgi:hypothetical protein